MKDHYVSYQQAIKLKELELSGEVTGKYVDCPNDPTLFNGMLYQSWNLENDEVLAPRLDQAQTWLREEKEIDVPIVLNHYPDKSKSRSSYLPLLEISVEEDPENDRNIHYLGREYMYYKKWDQCIDMLHKHLNCKNATWKDERCASMRFLGRAYQAKEFYEEAELWFKRAIEEAPYLREGYVECASFKFSLKQYEEAYNLLEQANLIQEKSKSYINEEFAWNDAFYDLFSLAAFYSAHYKEAIVYLKKAIELNPHEERYQKNLILMEPYSL